MLLFRLPTVPSQVQASSNYLPHHTVTSPDAFTQYVFVKYSISQELLLKALVFSHQNFVRNLEKNSLDLQLSDR